MSTTNCFYKENGRQMGQMRQFFKEILLNLYIYCGNRQADKMSEEEIKALLDALERMSKIYSYIPQEKQKEIILTQLVSDREYQNINVRTVSKWLEQNGKIFFTQECHSQDKGKLTEADYTPLEGEARAEKINEFLNVLAKVNTNFSTGEIKGRGAQMRENLDNAGIIKYNPVPEDESALNDYLTQQSNATPNQEGIKGTGEATGLPENSNQSSQQDNGV